MSDEEDDDLLTEDEMWGTAGGGVVFLLALFIRPRKSGRLVLKMLSWRHVYRFWNRPTGHPLRMWAAEAACLEHRGQRATWLKPQRIKLEWLVSVKACALRAKASSSLDIQRT